jgi:hypothetical protein
MLIALAWDDHEHNQAAHAWFSANSKAGFATCHVTQSGFIRLSLNPDVVKCQIPATEATAKLISFTSQPAHSFWEDGPVDTNSELWHKVTGHKQVSDTNLLLIAKRRGGKLATFDAAIKNRLPPSERDNVEVVSAPTRT